MAAQVSPQHVAPLTSGVVGLLLLAVISIGLLNRIANKA
jgi:hypothetical protein